MTGTIVSAVGDIFWHMICMQFIFYCVYVHIHMPLLMERYTHLLCALLVSSSVYVCAFAYTRVPLNMHSLHVYFPISVTEHVLQSFHWGFIIFAVSIIVGIVKAGPDESLAWQLLYSLSLASTSCRMLHQIYKTV